MSLSQHIFVGVFVNAPGDWIFAASVPLMNSPSAPWLQMAHLSILVTSPSPARSESQASRPTQGPTFDSPEICMHSCVKKLQKSGHFPEQLFLLPCQLGKRQPQPSFSDFSNMSQIPGPALLNPRECMSSSSNSFLKFFLLVELWVDHTPALCGEGSGDSQHPDSSFSEKSSFFSLSKAFYSIQLP